MTRIDQICTWSHGTWLAHEGDVDIKELVIDTRKIAQPEEALFIALKASRRDGHSFIADAYEKGVRNFLVHQPVAANLYPDSNFIQVNDTLAALHQIVIAYRKQFQIPVIGITGSNGKTVVKEWLYQLLSASYNLVRSPKSYNSQIGVPLSVWLLEPEHELAVFEAGISQVGEMEKLERMIQPEIGIFTNIGEAHSEGFLNQRQKINEKLLLFRHAKHLIYCKDYPELNEYMVQYFQHMKGGAGEEGLKLFTWSHKTDADLRIGTVEKLESSTRISAAYKGNSNSVTIPFTDPASVENAIHCWSLMLLLGIEQDHIAEQMSQLHPVAMRLELRQGINDCTVINDTYNSDLTSLNIALDFLEQQKQHTHRTVVLSDMFQMGKSDSELYEGVAALIGRRNIQRFIGVGPALHKHKPLFRQDKKLRSIFFKSTEDFLKNFHLISFEQDAVLLKGARAFRFEKIGMLLEQKVHQTVLSINLSAVIHNLNVFRGALQPGVKTMAMVKAFSYGSGSYEIAHLLQYSGVDYLSVAYTDEGVALRKAGITMPIMVMSPDAISFDRMIAWKLEPEIFNLRSLKLFTDIANTLLVKDYPIHIKLDTGMHRLGFVESELGELAELLSRTPQVKVASIFSHLAASEDISLDGFTEEQASRFKRMSGKLIADLGYEPMRHLCNSAGIARHPGLHFDMVRLGLGLYGIDGSGILQSKLKTISTLRTTIAQIKHIGSGETVGYGRKGYVDRDTRIATICIGYADGYPRNLGNGKSYVLIHGKQARLVGVVCMDMCMVDVTDIPEATEGDEAIVFGPDLPVSSLAKWSETIPYEVMTGISQRVKRVYVNEE
jgi:alanine racemase